MAVPEPPTASKAARSWGPWILLAVGLVVLSGLMLAERKTALTGKGNQPQATASRDGRPASEATPAVPGVDWAERLPEPQLNTVETQVVRQLQQQLSQAKEPAARADLLDKLSSALENAGQPLQAAAYADALASLRSEPEYQLRAARLLSSAISELPAETPAPQYQAINQAAIRRWEAYLQTVPGSKEGQKALALRQVEGPQPMQGILKLRALAEKNPQDLELQLQLGKFALQTQQLDKALERFTRVLAQAPQHAEAAYFAGLVHKAQGDKTKARTFAARALENATAPTLRARAADLLKELDAR